MLRTARSDLAWRLWRDGYHALAEERRQRDGADFYLARMLGRRTTVVRGEEGARLFYDESVVARSGAVPAPLAWLLFGRGAVHGLDDDEHRRRKSLHLDLLTRERTDPLVTAIHTRLAARVPAWSDGVAVFDELVGVYGAAVLDWAGVPADETAAARTSARLAELVDGFGFAGGAYLRGWRSRLLLDRWATRLVRETRAGAVAVAADRPLARVAARGDLDDRTAAVELLNLLRPTVAVAWPATLALAHLLRLPDRESMTSPDLIEAYVHECRRLQPFVPALAGRVRRPTTRGGVELRPGDRIVLDVVGTDEDPRAWALHAGERTGATDFDPHRFVRSEPSPYALVPQGGGDPEHGHRCPGESLTVRILLATLREVSQHDLRLLAGGRPDLRRIPALPDPPLRVSATARDGSAQPGYRSG